MLVYLLHHMIFDTLYFGEQHVRIYLLLLYLLHRMIFDTLYHFVQQSS